MSFDLKISNGDIILDPGGDVDIVTDNEKLRQDILKLLLTKLGSNKYHKYYGTALGALEVGGVMDKDFIEADIVSTIQEGLQVLMRLQAGQLKKQLITAGEVIASVLGVDVKRDLSDPRLYNVSVSVLTRRLTHLTESVSVKIA